MIEKIMAERQNQSQLHDLSQELLSQTVGNRFQDIKLMLLASINALRKEQMAIEARVNAQLQEERSKSQELERHVQEGTSKIEDLKQRIQDLETRVHELERQDPMQVDGQVVGASALGDEQEIEPEFYGN